MKSSKRNRSIGKAALFLSILGPLGVIGIAFAVLDIISDKKKEYKHGLSIAAILVSCVFFGYLIYALIFFDGNFFEPFEEYEIEQQIIDTEDNYLPADVPILGSSYDESVDEPSDESTEDSTEESIENTDLIPEEEDEIEIIILDEDEDVQSEDEASDVEEPSDEAVGDSDEVTLVIPKDFVGESSQAELDAVVKEKGYKNAILNDDGSVTYVLSKSQHSELIDGISRKIDGHLKDMAGSKSYPNITSVESNEDYTSFTVKTKNQKLDAAESSSVIEIYMYGGMYAAFSGKKVDNIHVDYVNDATGEIISSANSKDVGKDI